MDFYKAGPTFFLQVAASLSLYLIKTDLDEGKRLLIISLNTLKLHLTGICESFMSWPWTSFKGLHWVATSGTCRQIEAEKKQFPLAILIQIIDCFQKTTQGFSTRLGNWALFSWSFSAAKSIQCFSSLLTGDTNDPPRGVATIFLGTGRAGKQGPRPTIGAPWTTETPKCSWGRTALVFKAGGDMGKTDGQLDSELLG